MNCEQLTDISAKTTDEKYIKFISDVGWKYQTKEELDAGYARLVKTQRGDPLTWEEFLAELQIEGDPATAKQLYHTLRQYVECGALSAYDLYHYAKYRWCIKCPKAVTAYQIGKKRWAVNSCSEVITEERAKLMVNADFGFEASRIKLLGVPYYDATDWNYITFHCGAYDWVMWNGNLHQIYQ